MRAFVQHADCYSMPRPLALAIGYFMDALADFLHQRTLHRTENVEIWSRLIEQLAGNVILFGMKKGISVQDANPTRQPNSICWCKVWMHKHKACHPKGTMHNKNNMKTQVFRGEPMENIMKLRFSVGNKWKTLWKHRLSVGTYGKHSENTGVPWEPMENNRKTQVFRGNQWKTNGKH